MHCQEAYISITHERVIGITITKENRQSHDQGPSESELTRKAPGEYSPRATARGLRRAVYGFAVYRSAYYRSGFTKGNSTVSRIPNPVNAISKRSMPIPVPAVGGMPCSIAWRKSSSRTMASSSPPAAKRA